jgi:hypothetical protein
MHGFTDKNSPKSGPLCGMSDERRITNIEEHEGIENPEKH